jgi:hypothetical protein
MRMFAVVASIFAVMGSPAAGQCPGGTSKAFGSKHPVIVTRLGDKVFFGVSELALDFDGNPKAYGVRDQGQENICNGLAPSAGECRGKIQGNCYSVCRQTFAAWSRASHDPRTIPETMCSVGLGGSNCSVPDVHTQGPPAQDWFVSETSLKTSPASGAITNRWTESQAAQLDPNQIRYLVVPRSLLRAPWGVRLGDVGIALDRRGGDPVPFVVGDGGALGEGAVSLLAALRPSAPPTLSQATSALGDRVMRYESGISGDFRFVIFRNTASLVNGRSDVTTHSLSGLQAWVNETASTAFRQKSNRDEILACSRGR